MSWHPASWQYRDQPIVNGPLILSNGLNFTHCPVKWVSFPTPSIRRLKQDNKSFCETCKINEPNNKCSTCTTFRNGNMKC